jgi:hypothetical protein
MKKIQQTLNGNTPDYRNDIAEPAFQISQVGRHTENLQQVDDSNRVCVNLAIRQRGNLPPEIFA